MPRPLIIPYRERLKRERIRQEHPNRTRLTKAQREARRERIDFKAKKEREKTECV